VKAITSRLGTQGDTKDSKGIPLGGPGSGHHGHAGRPGVRGGSLPGEDATASRLGSKASQYADLPAKPFSLTKYEAMEHGTGTELPEERFVKRIPNRDTEYMSDEEIDGVLYSYEIEKQVAKDIADLSGETPECCARIIEQWATSSNDSSPLSISIQQAAADEFGVGLSDWQQKKIDSFATFEEILDIRAEKSNAEHKMNVARKLADKIYAKYKADPTPELRKEAEDAYSAVAPLATIFKERFDIWKHTIREMPPVLSGYVPDPVGSTRRILRAMYDHTQAELKKSGINFVTLFRGFDNTGQEAPEFGSTVSVGHNALSSWSGSYKIASHFGRYILSIQVPASRVMSTCRTGLGCLYEHEFVLLGDTGADDMAHVLERMEE